MFVKLMFNMYVFFQDMREFFNLCLQIAVENLMMFGKLVVVDDTNKYSEILEPIAKQGCLDVSFYLTFHC